MEPVVFKAFLTWWITYLKHQLAAQNEYNKNYRMANRKKVNDSSLKSYKKHRIKRIAERAVFRKKNILQERETWRIRHRERLKRDPWFKLRCNLTGRVYKALKSVRINKSKSTMELIGCSIAQLRQHLETRFQPGMSWENYGPVWHVDHIKPCAKFDLTNPEQQKFCFHFSNLQPLFASENIRKGAK